MCWLPANAERQKQPFEAPGGSLDEVRAFEADPVAFSQVLHVAAAHEELRGLESDPNLGPRLLGSVAANAKGHRPNRLGCSPDSGRDQAVITAAA